MYFLRRVLSPAADPSPGGAGAEPKKDERALPPPPPPQPPAAKEKPPELAADALHGLSERITRLEKQPVTKIGAVGVFVVVALACGLVVGLIALIARFARREPEAAPVTPEE